MKKKLAFIPLIALICCLALHMLAGKQASTAPVQSTASAILMPKGMEAEGILAHAHVHLAPTFYVYNNFAPFFKPAPANNVAQGVKIKAHAAGHTLWQYILHNTAPPLYLAMRVLLI